MAAVVTTLLLAPGFPVSAQMKPSVPGTPGDPVWQRTLHLSDGRTFVTDGALAMDAALAKPASLPDSTLPAASAARVESYLAAPLEDECAFADLKANADGRTYTAPSGLRLNATYINFLKRTLSTRSLRFRMGKELQPMVILFEGKRVGVLMAVRR
jgi:hypothetical protein